MAFSMPVTSAPHDSIYTDEFKLRSTNGWYTETDRGELRIPGPQERPAHSHPSERPSWLILQDDTNASDTRTSVAIKDDSDIDKGLTSFLFSAILERDTEAAAGGIGIGVGVRNASHMYQALFKEGSLEFYAPNATTGGMDLEATVIPAHSPVMTPPMDSLDNPHRYGILVDGSTIRVLIDGGVVYETTAGLPASGFGVAVVAEDDAKLWMQRAQYTLLDAVAPAVTIDRPESGRIYAADIGIGQTLEPSLLPIVAGRLTVDGTATDADSGVAWIRVEVDGWIEETLFDTAATHTTSLSASFAIHSADYSPGVHTITVTTCDYAGHVTSTSMDVLMVPTTGLSIEPAVKQDLTPIP